MGDTGAGPRLSGDGEPVFDDEEEEEEEDVIVMPETIIPDHHHHHHHRQQRDASREHLLFHHDVNEESDVVHREQHHNAHGAPDSNSNSERGHHRTLSKASLKRSAGKVAEVLRDLHGNELLKSWDFWLLSSILALCELSFFIRER